MSLESVHIGNDRTLLPKLFEFYAPWARVVRDVTANRRKMWKGVELDADLKFYDADPDVEPDAVCLWDELPDADASVCVLVYDPPHLPIAAATARSLDQYKRDYGLERSTGGDNIAAMHASFLNEAKRVLRPDGLIFAKIKDYVHNHRYQWNLFHFVHQATACGLTPCDLIIKRDPCGGNLKSGRWVRRHHVRNVHCYWAIVRKGGCESKLLKA